MELQLCYTTSENNAITKQLNDIVSLTGTLRSESSVIHPVIMIEANSIRNYNYAYIPQFGRYYYITGVTNFRNNLWIVNFSVDVLMSFRNSILNTQCVLLETEVTGADPYLPDSRVWVTKVKDKTDIVPFPNGLLSQGEYILITAGG